jgi:hypothetical protein
MKRRRKALSARTVTEQERALAAGNVEAALPNGSSKYIPAASSNSYRNQLHKNKGMAAHGKYPAKSVPINGRKYPQTTSSTVHGRSPVAGFLELDSSSEQALKRHSLYYSVESMASLASAIEENP